MNKIIAMTQRGEDWAVAAAKLHTELDPTFVAEIKKLRGWENSTEQDLLETQTFVAWYRKCHDEDASIQDCIENTEYAWAGLEVENV